MTDLEARIVEAAKRSDVLARQIMEANRGAGPSPHSDLWFAAAHASSALSRHTDTLEALAAFEAAPSPALRARVMGEASQAMLALYLAVSAAGRHRKAAGIAGPLTPSRHRDLEARTGHMRDTLMHWHQKGERDRATFINVTVTHVTIYAPIGSVGAVSVVADLSWRRFESGAAAIWAWATSELARWSEPRSDESQVSADP